MTKITCTRRLTFCAGHRVMNHEGKCKNPHGHNYTVLFHASAPSLDALGRIIDFSVLKEKLGGWLDTHWDHKFIVAGLDAPLIHALWGTGLWVGPLTFNPTAEAMAEYLLKQVAPQQLAGTSVTIEKVELWETENCLATAYI